MVHRSSAGPTLRPSAYPLVEIAHNISFESFFREAINGGSWPLLFLSGVSGWRDSQESHDLAITWSVHYEQACDLDFTGHRCEDPSVVLLSEPNVREDSPGPAPAYFIHCELGST